MIRSGQGLSPVQAALAAAIPEELAELVLEELQRGQGEVHVVFVVDGDGHVDGARSRVQPPFRWPRKRSKAT